MTGIEFASKNGLHERDIFVIKKKYPSLNLSESDWKEKLKKDHTIPILENKAETTTIPQEKLEEVKEEVEEIKTEQKNNSNNKFKKNKK